MEREEQKPAPSRPLAHASAGQSFIATSMTTKPEDVEPEEVAGAAHGEGGRVEVASIQLAERRLPCSKSPTPQSPC
jgi:hypothetical protein